MFSLVLTTSNGMTRTNVSSLQTYRVVLVSVPYSLIAVWIIVHELHLPVRVSICKVSELQTQSETLIDLYLICKTRTSRIRRLPRISC